jgi:hypothetical protein
MTEPTGRDAFHPKIVYKRPPRVPPRRAVDPQPPPAERPVTVRRGWVNGPVVPRRRPAQRVLQRRTAGLWWLAGIDLGIAVSLLFGVLWLYQVRVYEIERSFDIAEELQIALAGLNLMMVLAVLASAGFAVSLLGVLSLKRIGWLAALLWAIAMTMTGIGAAYGIPAIVYLASRSTRRRFEGAGAVA